VERGEKTGEKGQGGVEGHHSEEQKTSVFTVWNISLYITSKLGLSKNLIELISYEMTWWLIIIINKSFKLNFRE